MPLRRSTKQYDLGQLAKDTRIVLSLTSFEQGRRGHSISLLSPNMVPESYRSHRLNTPFTGTIQQCPYISKIYASIQTEILTMRLLQRKPFSSYKLHSDNLMFDGEPTIRLQVPISDNKNAYLCISDTHETGGRIIDEVPYFSSIDEFMGHPSLKKYKFHFFKMEPGRMYYFDVRRLHTVVNSDANERVSLVFDVKENEWTRALISDFEYVNEMIFEDHFDNIYTGKNSESI